MQEEKLEKHYLGHRQRLKEKFVKTNFSSWQDYEILEFALTFVIPRKDTKLIAKNLIKKFGSLKQVLQADTEKLYEVEGIKNHSAIFIKFLKEFCLKYSQLQMKSKEKISTPLDVLNFFQINIGSSKDEIIYSLFLNASNKILAHCPISSGVVNRSAMYPRKIVELALKFNATSVIIAHNHPGGSCKPSQNDIIATDAVIKALKTVDVVLLDHLIVTGSGYYSFKDNNLI